MKSETKKFRVKKELKFRVPAETLKRIEKATKGYSKKQDLVDATNGVIRNEYISNLLKTKLATQTMLNNILSGVEILENQAA